MWDLAYWELFRDLDEYSSETPLIDWVFGRFQGRNCSRATGLILRQVECESCEYHYGYLMKRVATVNASGMGGKGGQALDAALKFAKFKVKKELKRMNEVVPCPRCGRIQHDMLALAKKDHLRGLLYFGIAVCALAILVGSVGGLFYFLANRAGGPSPTLPLFGGAVGSFGLSGLALILIRSVLNSILDPNRSNVARRIALGQRRALKPQKLEKALDLFEGKDHLVVCQED